MAVALQQFVDQLADSGLMSKADVETLLDSLPANHRPKDGEQFARELVRQKKLTAFQAQQIYAGKGKSLVLGNYVLLDKLGQGGMGMVLKAEHRRMKRLVALKVLSPKVTKTPDALRRFQREVEAAAKLRHPNIVAADDADEANGVHFLVMEFVEGSDLSALVKAGGALPLDKALHCVIQAARGLEYAHHRGVVHRDVKPANLLLDKDGTVKILDMGLARLDSAGVQQDELTGTGQIMGTVAYMAPEQALNTKHADARADIYSLGVTLWYLLTGRPMYEGETAMEKLMAHQSQPIPPLTEHCPAATSALQAVFEKMVAKTPAARYQTMAEVISDLERCRDGSASSPSRDDNPGANTHANDSLRGASSPSASAKPPTLTKRPPIKVMPMTEMEATIGFGLPQAETDPETQESLPRPFAVMIQQDATRTHGTIAASRNRHVHGRRVKQPPLWLIAVGAAGAFLVLLAGIWVIVRDRDGNEVARIEVPDGGKAEVVESRFEAQQTRTQQSVAPRTKGNDQPADVLRPAIAPFDAPQARKYQEAWAAQLKLSVEFENSIGMKLRLIPAGEFLMGAVPDDANAMPDEVPQHSVRISQPFYLGTYEVTQEEYEKVIGANPSFFGKRENVGTETDTKRWPAEQVRWEDAVTFCERLSALPAEHDAGRNYRLPTEAEWEYTTRAGTTTIFTYGNTLGSNQANFNGAYQVPRSSTGPWLRRPEIVGKYSPNAFGLYDMLGNVWEWCGDTKRTYDPQLQTDPRGPASGSHINRGGGWISSAGECRSSHRRPDNLRPEDRHRSTGLRVVCEIAQATTNGWGSGIPQPAIAPLEAEPAKAQPTERPADLKVPEIKVLWKQSPHSAFTDLINFQGRWLCVFRDGQSANSFDGQLRLLASVDGTTWRPSTPVTLPGRDLRDPKLRITPDNQLMLIAATRTASGDEQSFVWYSMDGEQWTTGSKFGDAGWRMWDMAWQDRIGYSLAYRVAPPFVIRLYGGSESQMFRPISQNDLLSDATEAALLFLPDARLLTVVRRNAGSTAMMGISHAPYDTWTWKDVGKEVAGTRLMRLSDGRLLLAARLLGQTRTSLCWLDVDNGVLAEFLTLATSSDCGYPGVVELDGQLWVSYYSSHEGQARVYLAKVSIGPGTLPPPAKAPFSTAGAKDHQDAWAKHLSIHAENTNSVGMHLVLIPPGEFLMGRLPDESRRFPPNGLYQEPLATQHRVTLTRPYLIGTTEVTQRQWRDVMDSEPWRGKDRGEIGDDYPATYTSKPAAQDFCQRLSEKEGKKYRLPTEAEWEFACRAGSDTLYFFGENHSQVGDYACRESLQRVATKKPNPWGLFDMYGNVWEWVADGRTAFTADAVVDPLLNSGDQDSIIRGSCFRSAIPGEFSSGARYSWPGALPSDEKGFRVVCEVMK